MATTVEHFGGYKNEQQSDIGPWPRLPDLSNEDPFAAISRKRKVPSSGNPRVKRRRVNAAGKERERLRAFNDALESLQSVLPIRFTENRKMYKKQTLQLAIRYIEFLRSCAVGERDWSERTRFWCRSEDKLAIGAMDAVCHTVDPDETDQHQSTTVFANPHCTGAIADSGHCVESLPQFADTDSVPSPSVGYGDLNHNLQSNLAIDLASQAAVDPSQLCDMYAPAVNSHPQPANHTCLNTVIDTTSFTTYPRATPSVRNIVVNESFTSYQSYMQGRCIELTVPDNLKTNCSPPDADLNDIPMSDLLNSEAVSDKQRDFASFDDEMLTQLDEILSSSDTSQPSSPESGFASFNSL